MTYEIVSHPIGESKPFTWTADDIGEPNAFPTVGAARAAAQALLDLGGDWLNYIYGIQVVGEGVVLEHWLVGRNLKGHQT